MDCWSLLVVLSCLLLFFLFFPLLLLFLLLSFLPLLLFSLFRLLLSFLDFFLPFLSLFLLLFFSSLLNLSFRSFLFLLFLDRFLPLIGVKLIMFNFSAGVSNLKRQPVGSPVDNKHFQDLKFDLLSTALYGFSWVDDQSNKIDDTFIRDISHVSDHFLGDAFRFEFSEKLFIFYIL